jgi:hypothetical protein
VRTLHRPYSAAARLFGPPLDGVLATRRARHVGPRPWTPVCWHRSCSLITNGQLMTQNTSLPLRTGGHRGGNVTSSWPSTKLERRGPRPTAWRGTGRSAAALKNRNTRDSSDSRRRTPPERSRRRAGQGARAPWSRRAGRCRCDDHRPGDDGSERDTTPAPPVRLGRSRRARERSSLDASWPCGQDAQPKPGCHRRRDQRTRREAGSPVLAAAAGVVSLRRSPTGSVASSYARTEGSNSMTRKTQDSAAGRRGELHRERGARRPSAGGNVRRSPSAHGAHNSVIEAHVTGRSDPRYAYLRQQHD